MNRCGVIPAVGLALAMSIPCGPAIAQGVAKAGVKAGAKTSAAAPGAGRALTWKEAMGRVGEQVVVEGMVANVKIRKDASPHLLVFGANWKESLSVALMDKDKFGDVQATYQGRKIRVRGKVTLYRNAAQIRVTDPAQIAILE